MRIRKMNTWKMAVGCLICVILFTPIFFPVFHVSEKQIALSIVDMMEDCMGDEFYDVLKEELKSDSDDVLSELWNSANSTAADLVRKETEKEIKKQRKKINKNTELQDYSYNGLQVLTTSSQTIAKRIFSRDDDDRIFVGAINKSAREQTVKFINLYKWRVTFFLVGSIVLFVIFLLSGLKKKKITVSLIASGVYLLLYIIEQAVWYLTIPAKMAVKLNSYIGNTTKNNQLLYALYKQLKELGIDIQKLTTTMKVSTDTTKSLLKSFDGTALYVTVVGAVLLIIWMLVIVIVRDKADLITDEMPTRQIIPDGTMPNIPVGQQLGEKSYNSNPNIKNGISAKPEVQQRPYAGQNIRNNMSMQQPRQDRMVSGELRYELGELKGAQLTLKRGETITIGRDAKSCQLVLSNPSVAVKQCAIRMDPSGMFYEIIGYVDYGTIIYSGQQSQNLDRNQKICVGKGTRVAFAHDQEMIMLF